MDRRSKGWARWLRWTGLYALVFWGGWTFVELGARLAPGWDGNDLAAVVLVLGSLVLVFLVGVRYGSWWWVLSPLVVVDLPAFLVPVIGQTYLGWPSDPGWGDVVFFAAAYALVSAFLATAGVSVVAGAYEIERSIFHFHWPEW